MKISETKYDHIDEGPLDFLTKSGRANRRAFKSGRNTLKLTADNLKKEFAQYLGQQGKKNFKQATTQDVIDFLDDKNVDTSNIGPASMTPQRIDDIFAVKSKEAIQGKGAKPSAEVDDQKVKTVYSQVKGQLDQLSMKEKKRLLTALQKNIDTPKKKAANVPPFKSSRK